ncbi:hypothetical protein [Pseudokineococcus lusitanus]|uniref:Uncharacterized protein n=1 Tax=Pseudokineococcus lusitanus TaxID=763993 RepID=A0A3N1HTY8_9ACTN|nr:hypothetical protein [Pseudokineococcus lusitanus]ROP45971.1 hypothetical protein EDC03_0587 [Pseudokineococcus lusitanus]
MPRTRVSARRRTAQLLVGYGLPFAGAGAAYLFGVRDWLGARTAAAEWWAGQIAAAAPGVA